MPSLRTSALALTLGLTVFPWAMSRSQTQESLPGADALVNEGNTKGSQRETTIAANPLDPLNLAGAWVDGFQQERAVGFGWTRDGGLTWQSGRVTVPGMDFAFDPSMVADGRGRFYLGVVAAAKIPGSGGAVLPQVAVLRSDDNGATFGGAVVIGVGDKSYLAVDQTTGTVYETHNETGGPNLAIEFSRSTDGGATFSAPRIISKRGFSDGLGPIPMVGPQGELYVVWTDVFSTIWLDRSLDGGVTWLDDDLLVTDTVAHAEYFNPAFSRLDLSANAVDRSGGPFRGRLYVVWPDQRFGDPDILLVRSSDGGASWSAPVRVNDDAIGNGADQAGPWVNVDANGHVQVTFLDTREDPAGLRYGMYLATSTDGGVSFGPNIRVSDGIHEAERFGNLLDYTGAAVSGGRIHPIWPDARLGTNDVFSRGVNLADFDEDGVLNDGDGSGQYADNRCTAVLRRPRKGCDDNCPGTPNPVQADRDGDRVGDACDG